MSETPTPENDTAAQEPQVAPEQQEQEKSAPPAKKAAAKKTAAKKAAAKKAPAKKAAAKKVAAKKAAADPDAPDAPDDAGEAGEAGEAPAKKTAAKKAAAKKTTAKKTTAKKTAAKKASAAKSAADEQLALDVAPTDGAAAQADSEPVSEPVSESVSEPVSEAGAAAAPAVLFQAPATTRTRARTARPKAEAPATPAEDTPAEEVEEELVEGAEPTEAETETETGTGTEGESETGTEGETDGDDETDGEDGEGTGTAARRRRRRGGRRRRKPGQGANVEGSEDADGDDESEGADEATASSDAEAETDESGSEDAESGEAGEGQGGSSSSRRRRRRRRSGEGGADDADDPENTVTRVRKPRNPEDEITAVSGSTRLEAKKQRRREGREAGRRRAPIVSEAEFLARRESVERVMAVRQRKDLTQIAVLEDKVLVEHYVARESQTSMIGNVYLGRVQNVLPSMEAAFIDIGKGRNAVLYAGEVNWSALGHKDGQPRKIESVLQSGQTVLVQVTKDPVGHKGARLTSQVSLAGRFLVYVPDGTTSGISRKLPDTERARLKALLKEIVPETAGVIVRTAAEGASEEELTRDVERLKSRWEDIEAKVAKGNAPTLLYGEPDLTLKVVRDLFTEDFSKLVVQGEEVWNTVREYVEGVAPDLLERVEHHVPNDHTADLFAVHRIDEQIAKGLDRKVWLPSGGSLIIDRTEAMTVIDVNTGKFTGSGGNLEETVTKNNREAAEEIVRQLRLRDIGGIIVVDFIDMVLESNRDLVLRRMVECLGRDRTRHQVAEVTSLGLVQMTRKRIGTGLVEAFSENCSHCQGRGIVVHEMPVEPKRGGDGGNGGAQRGGGNSGNGGNGGGEGDGERRGRRRRGRGGSEGADAPAEAPKPTVPSPKDVAAMARHEDTEPVEPVEPVEEAPVEAPVEDAPVVETPVEEAPVVETPVEEAPAAETPVEEAPVEEAPVEEAPVAEAPAEQESSVDAPPAGGTRVSTRTRRSAATRPAGQPEAGAVAIVVAPAAEQTAVAPVVSTPPPTVTTRTRTRAARPAEAAGTSEATEAGGAADGEESGLGHVPIKKKGGSRKR